MKNMQKYKDDYLLMTEAGFIAVNRADEDAALKLFKAASLLDPKNMLPVVGLGYLHLHKLELEAAVQKFQEALKKDPNNEMAKAFLGLSMSLMPSQLDKGEKVLEESLRSSDTGIKKLAKTAIDFVEKFVKVTPGPAGKKKKNT